MSSKTNMEQTIQTIKNDNQELMKENASLKRQIGGYKAANERYRKNLENLEKCKEEAQDMVLRLQVELSNAKVYGKEADELNEKKVEQIASLNATVEEKDRVIAGLQSQIAELNKRIANNEKNIQDLTGERDVAIANYDYVCGLPWYQRMFFKGK